MIACTECLCPPGDNSSLAAQRRFLGFSTFSIRDLLRPKERHLSVSVRTMEGVDEIGELRMSHRQMKGQGHDKIRPEHECFALCDVLHSSVHDKVNSPMMRAALCAQVCKVYRFQTEDQRWLLVREQLSETPLSFSLPRQLLSGLIHEYTHRVQEVIELGDLSPHWDGIRQDVISHCNHLIGCYQDTLVELEKLSAVSCFKSSSRKSDAHLQFVPTNLHAQRMEVTDPDGTGAWYDVITFGAPADHHQAFKHGGLKRLMSKHRKYSSASYLQDQSSRARQLLSTVSKLQPHVFGLSEELLSVSSELNTVRLQEALEPLTQQIGQLVHALKDELVKSALIAIHGQSSAHFSCSHVHSNGHFCDNSPTSDRLSLGQQEVHRRDEEYDEDEWDIAWANVATSLSCIIAMADRLKGQDLCPHKQQETPGSTASPSSSSWQEQLLPLVITLRDCVREAVTKAQAAMTFVVLQHAVVLTVDQGPAQMVLRRHAVFSQAISALVCGFALKLYSSLDDHDFLQQLHTVGVLAQFESLLSIYGDEEGMLEDMEVGVADLSQVAFTVTEAETDREDDLLPTLRGTWYTFVVEMPLPAETFRSLPQQLRDGCLIRVHPVVFNIGINQQQSLAERFGDTSLQDRLNHQNCERLRGYCETLRDSLPHLTCLQPLSNMLSSLDHCVASRKRKNVELLWTAAMVCRQVGGVRLTSCKSAKDRTAMSVTLEQCVLLRDRHALRDFNTALDCMRRSRQSWGQMLSCYARSDFTVSGFDHGSRPSTLSVSWMSLRRRHVYPVTVLLVTSHLLVLWLLLSLVTLLPKDQ